MSTLFSKIISGEIPCYKIHETENFLAFLDVNPLAEGHTLIIPKHPLDYIFDMPDAQLGEIHIYSKKIAIALKKAIPCVKIGIAVIGLEVPHAHIHLVPMNKVGDLNFTTERKKFNTEEYQTTLNGIKANL
ncbi:MAG: HIT family protein [Bacteroidetes bacterium]|nr:HIT family protein [Bacteroidota bacterium]